MQFVAATLVSTGFCLIARHLSEDVENPPKAVKPAGLPLPRIHAGEHHHTNGGGDNGHTETDASLLAARTQVGVSTTEDDGSEQNLQDSNDKRKMASAVLNETGHITISGQKNTGVVGRAGILTRDEPVNWDDTHSKTSGPATGEQFSEPHVMQNGADHHHSDLRAHPFESRSIGMTVSQEKESSGTYVGQSSPVAAPGGSKQRMEDTVKEEITQRGEQRDAGTFTNIRIAERALVNISTVLTEVEMPRMSRSVVVPPSTFGSLRRAFPPPSSPIFPDRDQKNEEVEDTAQHRSDVMPMYDGLERTAHRGGDHNQSRHSPNTTDTLHVAQRSTVELKSNTSCTSTLADKLTLVLDEEVAPASSHHRILQANVTCGRSLDANFSARRSCINDTQLKTQIPLAFGEGATANRTSCQVENAVAPSTANCGSSNESTTLQIIVDQNTTLLHGEHAPPKAGLQQSRSVDEDAASPPVCSSAVSFILMSVCGSCVLLFLVFYLLLSTMQDENNFPPSRSCTSDELALQLPAVAHNAVVIPSNNSGSVESISPSTSAAASLVLAPAKRCSAPPDRTTSSSTARATKATSVRNEYSAGPQSLLGEQNTSGTGLLSPPDRPSPSARGPSIGRREAKQQETASARRFVRESTRNVVGAASVVTHLEQTEDSVEVEDDEEQQVADARHDVESTGEEARRGISATGCSPSSDIEFGPIFLQDKPVTKTTTTSSSAMLCSTSSSKNSVQHSSSSSKTFSTVEDASVTEQRDDVGTSPILDENQERQEVEETFAFGLGGSALQELQYSKSESVIVPEEQTASSYHQNYEEAESAIGPVEQTWVRMAEHWGGPDFRDKCRGSGTNEDRHHRNESLCLKFPLLFPRNNGEKLTKEFDGALWSISWAKGPGATSQLVIPIDCAKIRGAAGDRVTVFRKHTRGTPSLTLSLTVYQINDETLGPGAGASVMQCVCFSKVQVA
ncbi:unnamed protein product [Amoebophrya sp. A120]|nr:unnamed protein product [Amoebophrya sp. A120]|eukprot:GSA120T00025541001.1